MADTDKTKKLKKAMTPRQRRLAWIFGIIEVILLIAAQADIQRRPAAQIKGPKWRWRLISLANVVGPLAYFFLGRKPA